MRSLSLIIRGFNIHVSTDRRGTVRVYLYGRRKDGSGMLGNSAEYKGNINCKVWRGHGLKYAEELPS